MKRKCHPGKKNLKFLFEINSLCPICYLVPWNPHNRNLIHSSRPFFLWCYRRWFIHFVFWYVANVFLWLFPHRRSKYNNIIFCACCEPIWRRIFWIQCFLCRGFDDQYAVFIRILGYAKRRGSPILHMRICCIAFDVAAWLLWIYHVWRHCLNYQDSYLLNNNILLFFY